MKKGFNLKTRLVAILLSVVSLVSVFTMAATSVSAAEVEDNGSLSIELPDAKTRTLIVDGIKNIVAVAKCGNPLEAGWKFLSSAWSMYTGYTSEPGPSIQDVLDKMDELSNQMTGYYDSEKALLDKIDLKLDSQQFKDTMNDVSTDNEQALVVLEAQIDSEYANDAQENDALLEKSTEDRQRDVYNEIVKCTLDKDEYSHRCFLVENSIIGDSDVYDKAFDLFLKEAELATDNADDVKESLNQIADFCMGQLTIAYTSRLTGYEAQKRLAILDDNEAALNTVLSQSKADTDKFLKLADEYERVIDSLDSIEACKVSANGNEMAYHSLADAWVDATKYSTGDVTITLSKDFELNEGESFSRDWKLRQGEDKCFSGSALYVNNSDLDLTIDLNGHTLSREGNVYTIFAENTRLTVNNGTFGSVKLNAKNYDEAKSFHFSHVDFLGNCEKESAIFSNKVKVFGDYSLFDKYTNSAISTNKGVVVDNTTFRDNHSSTNGGAVYYTGSDDLVNFLNCEFKNNSADHTGGAICNKWGTTSIKECNFKNNSALNAGALYTQGSTYINDSEFVGNSAKQNGGAIMSTHGISDGAKWVLSGDTFEYNEAQERGGAISLEGYWGATIENTTITNNKSSSHGAGMYADLNQNKHCRCYLNGTVVITDNHNTDGSVSNVTLDWGGFSVDNLNKDSKIGVNKIEPFSSGRARLTESSGNDVSSVFTCERANAKLVTEGSTSYQIYFVED